MDAPYPLFILILSAAALREQRLSRHALVGVALAVADVALLLAR